METKGPEVEAHRPDSPVFGKAEQEGTSSGSVGTTESTNSRDSGVFVDEGVNELGRKDAKAEAVPPAKVKRGNTIKRLWRSLTSGRKRT